MVSNRFSRLAKLYGDKKVDAMSGKCVMIIGIGGVGGYVVEALARSNIGTLILVDYDTVEESNINRQIIALDNTLNRLKTECFKERIKLINPHCKVITINEYITVENYQELFKYKVDYIADCCDTVKTKEKIIEYALLNNFNIISSMGTGNRENPEDLEITDITKTKGDPLAKKIRKYLRDNHINKKLMVMCSKEIPHHKIEDVIPSNSFVPPSAGLLIASYIIKKLISKTETE